MAAERRAAVTWNGDLMSGSGTIDEVGSGAFGAARRQLGGTVGGGVGWQDEPGGADRSGARILLLDGACARLAQAGNAPERLQTSAVVTFVPGTGITKSALTVRGTVPGLDADGFREAAEDAKKNCPVSQALAGVPEITLDAELA